MYLSLISYIFPGKEEIIYRHLFSSKDLAYTKILKVISKLSGLNERDLLTRFNFIKRFHECYNYGDFELDIHEYIKNIVYQYDNTNFNWEVEEIKCDDDNGEVKGIFPNEPKIREYDEKNDYPFMKHDEMIKVLGGENFVPNEEWVKKSNEYSVGEHVVITCEGKFRGQIGYIKMRVDSSHYFVIKVVNTFTHIDLPVYEFEIKPSDVIPPEASSI